MPVKIPVNFLIIMVKSPFGYLFICLFEKHILEESAGRENLVSITELFGAAEVPQWLGALTY